MIARVENSSPSASVICEEVFDEGYQPSNEEIFDYAMKLGIDPVKETHLLYLAKEGLMQALPSDWKICYSEEQDAHYYYNTKSKISQWDHPLDADYRELAEKIKQKEIPSIISSVVENCDDISKLDSGIQSLHVTDTIDLNSKIAKPSSLKNNATFNSKNSALFLTEVKSFSGEVNKFLESRPKYFPLGESFPIIKMSRFEITKTNPQKDLDKKSNYAETLHNSSLILCKTKPESENCYSISETETIFLKSNVQKRLESHNLNETKKMKSTLELFPEITSTGMKGILRDSSLTDMRRNLEVEGGEDKKSVRFNLDDKPCSSTNEDNDYCTKLSNCSEALKAFNDRKNRENNENGNKKLVSRTTTVEIARTYQEMEDTGFSLENQSTLTIPYLNKLNDKAFKPLNELTNSETKNCSLRNLAHETYQDLRKNPFELEAVDKMHKNDVEQFGGKGVDFLTREIFQFSEKQETDFRLLNVSEEIDKLIENEIQEYGNTIYIMQKEKRKFEEKLQLDIEILKKEHNIKLKSLNHEHDLELVSLRHQLEENLDKHFEIYKTEMEESLNIKRKTVVQEHKGHMATLQKNHLEILQDLERDLKSEEELLKKEHSSKLLEMRNKLTYEMELERQKMRETGEDHLYEKVRCEKRLLEDKYRCLKEKYVRLKTDVRLSLERRSRRREQQAVLLKQQSLSNTATGSETERSTSNKPSIGNSETRSISISPSLGKPPLPPKAHLNNVREISMRAKSSEDQQFKKISITSNYIKHFQVQDDNTCISQSDNTISNNYSQGRYLPAPILSDNGNSDSEALQNNQENNNNLRMLFNQKKTFFTRLKSASTSRLNSDNFKEERPCTPVENLRHQLQKLEDLEDQFPDNTLDATYHLRYPFSDVSNERAGTSSAELEFFKHRIHLERDSVRRAKESLRIQRTNFRTRQKEIKQHHKINVIKHSLGQLINEEKELTEMEVNLHRTRALLGEKVIRLRHLEQSLQRIFHKEKPIDFIKFENKDDTTLSDISSHSSSGFSSTDIASIDIHNLNRRKETSECIQNLEILNVEIREILDVLNKQSGHGLSISLNNPQTDLNWKNLLSFSDSGQVIPSNSTYLHASHSIPTLTDRLETYRQLATGRMGGAILAANTIVSQNPKAINYTTSLVERTRDLRNWLRQAKTEHEILTFDASRKISSTSEASSGDNPHTNI